MCRRSSNKPVFSKKLYLSPGGLVFELKNAYTFIKKATHS